MNRPPRRSCVGEILTIGYTGGWNDAFCSDQFQNSVCKMPARKRRRLTFSRKTII